MRFAIGNVTPLKFNTDTSNYHSFQTLTFFPTHHFLDIYVRFPRKKSPKWSVSSTRSLVLAENHRNQTLLGFTKSRCNTRWLSCCRDFSCTWPKGLLQRCRHGSDLAEPSINGNKRSHTQSQFLGSGFWIWFTTWMLFLLLLVLSFGVCKKPQANWPWGLKQLLFGWLCLPQQCIKRSIILQEVRPMTLHPSRSSRFLLIQLPWKSKGH